MKKKKNNNNNTKHEPGQEDEERLDILIMEYLGITVEGITL